MPHPVRYTFELQGRPRTVLSVRGEESMASPFLFEVELHVEPDDDLDPDAVVGSRAVLVLERDAEVRRVTGLVSDVVRFGSRAGIRAGAGRVLVTLEPPLARARHRVDIRVFRDKTAPDMVQEVLGALSIVVEDRLSGSYPVRPYTVQFKESDLAFASRLLEDEGIGSFVDEAGALVLFDAPGGYEPSIGVLPFRHGAGLDETADALHEVGWSGRITAGKVTLRDFNPEHPSLDMDVHADGPYRAGMEFYDYPGEYEQPPEGSRKARLRADALRCSFERLSAIAHAPQLRPGVVFSLLGAPVGVADGDFVVVKVLHRWQRDASSFSLDVEGIPAERTYRPLPETPVPTITNPITGFVTGPPGADIHTDEWGRVKVHFPWDRLQEKDDHCSHWIPVLQDNTGRSSAMSRTGWEVACHFLEGDPDRPVVLGRVYNPEDKFHEMLPLGKTRTSLRSETSPRTPDGGENKIQFEDLDGEQYIFIQAQKDQNVVVANDKSQQIDVNEMRIVTGHETITVGNEHKVTVVSEATESVQANRTESVGASRKVDVKEDQGESIEGNHALTIGGSHTRKMKDNDTVSVDGSLKESIGGLILEASVKSNSLDATRTSALLVGGAIVEIARQGKSENTGKVRAEVVGGIHFIKAGDDIATSGGKSRTALIGAKLELAAVEALALSGVTKLSAKATTQEFTIEKGITLRVGSTQVTLEGGNIAFKADETITLRTQQKNKQGSDDSQQI